MQPDAVGPARPIPCVELLAGTAEAATVVATTEWIGNEREFVAVGAFPVPPHIRNIRNIHNRRCFYWAISVALGGAVALAIRNILGSVALVAALLRLAIHVIRNIFPREMVISGGLLRMLRMLRFFRLMGGRDTATRRRGGLREHSLAAFCLQCGLPLISRHIAEVSNSTCGR